MNEELEARWMTPHSLGSAEEDTTSFRHSGLESLWKTGYAVNAVHFLYGGRYVLTVCTDARAFLFDSERRRACGCLVLPKQLINSGSQLGEDMQIRSICECEVEGERFVCLVYTAQNSERQVSHCVFYKVSDCVAIRTLVLPLRVSSASIVCRAAQRWLVDRLAPALQSFDGLLLIGGERGKAYIVDVASELLLDNVAGTVANDDTVILLQANRDADWYGELRSRMVARGEHAAVELHTEASGQRGAINESIQASSTSYITLLDRIGCVLVGYSTGLIELHRVTHVDWPQLERVVNVHAGAGKQVHDTPVVSALLQEPTDDPRPTCFITVFSAPLETCEGEECVRQLGFALLQLVFTKRVIISPLFETESSSGTFYEQLDTISIVLQHTLAMAPQDQLSLLHVTAFSERASLLGDTALVSASGDKQGVEADSEADGGACGGSQASYSHIDGADCNASCTYLLAACYAVHRATDADADADANDSESQTQQASPQNAFDTNEWFFNERRVNKSDSGDAVWRSAATELRVALFDLDGWYKAQMPNAVGDWFLLERVVRAAPDVRACRIEARSVLRFANAQMPVSDELCWPGALSFALRAVDVHGLSLSMRTLHVESLQGSALQSLCQRGLLDATRQGVRLIDSLAELGVLPASVACACADTQTDNGSDGGVRTQIGRLDALLSALHENGALWLVERFVVQAITSPRDVDRAETSRLTDRVFQWALHRVESLCSSLDTLCTLLFDCPAAFGEVDCSISVRFELLVRLLDELQARILHRFADAPGARFRRDSSSPLHAELLALRLRLNFYKVFSLFSRFGLLRAERPLEQLVAYYDTRRNQLSRHQEDDRSLFIDRVVRECDAALGVYPPASVRTLLNAFLNPAIARHALNTVVAYLLADLAWCVGTAADYSCEIERRVAECYKVFCASACDVLRSHDVRVLEACWLLDHARFDDATDAVRTILVRPVPADCHTRWLEQLQRDALTLVSEADRVDLARSLLALSPLRHARVRKLPHFDALVRTLLHCALFDDSTPRFVDLGEPLAFVRRCSGIPPFSEQTAAFDRFLLVLFSLTGFSPARASTAAPSSRLVVNRVAFFESLTRASLTHAEHTALDRFFVTNLLGVGPRGFANATRLDDALIDALTAYYVRMRDADRLALVGRRAAQFRRGNSATSEHRRLLRKCADLLRLVPVRRFAAPTANMEALDSFFATPRSRPSAVTTPAPATIKRVRQPLNTQSAAVRRLLAPPAATVFIHDVNCSSVASQSSRKPPHSPKRVRLSLSRASPSTPTQPALMVRNRLASAVGSPHVSFLNVSLRAASNEASPANILTPVSTKRPVIFSQSRRLDESLVERQPDARPNSRTQLNATPQHQTTTTTSTSTTPTPLHSAPPVTATNWHDLSNSVLQEVPEEDAVPQSATTVEKNSGDEETDSNRDADELVPTESEAQELEDDDPNQASVTDELEEDGNGNGNDDLPEASSVASADSACFSPISSIGTCECECESLAAGDLSLMHRPRFSFALPTAVVSLTDADLSRLLEDDCDTQTSECTDVTKEADQTLTTAENAENQCVIAIAMDTEKHESTDTVASAELQQSILMPPTEAATEQEDTSTAILTTTEMLQQNIPVVTTEEQLEQAEPTSVSCSTGQSLLDTSSGVISTAVPQCTPAPATYVLLAADTTSDVGQRRSAATGADAHLRLRDSLDAHVGTVLDTDNNHTPTPVNGPTINKGTALRTTGAERPAIGTPTFMFAQPTIMSPQPLQAARTKRVRTRYQPNAGNEVVDSAQALERARARAAARSPPRTRSRARVLSTTQAQPDAVLLPANDSHQPAAMSATAVVGTKSQRKTSVQRPVSPDASSTDSRPKRTHKATALPPAPAPAPAPVAKAKATSRRSAAVKQVVDAHPPSVDNQQASPGNVRVTRSKKRADALAN